MFRIASAQATGYCLPGMASVMGGDGEMLGSATLGACNKSFSLEFGKDISGVSMLHEERGSHVLMALPPAAQRHG